MITKTSGFLLPHAIGETGDLLGRSASGESESGVALVSGNSSVSNVGRSNGEAVVDLRHWTAVYLLAFGNVGDGPVSTGQTLGCDFGFSSCEFLTKWAREGNDCAKGCVSARGHCSFTWLQRWAIWKGFETRIFNCS